jgi:hypothetical protein
MRYTVNFSAEFREWWNPLGRDLKQDILRTVRLLEEYGPNLSRPHADTLTGSKLKNLKELRVQHRGEPYRILFAFDPKREAWLLIGGNKAGDKKWYKQMIPLAETIFEAHLEKLRKEEEDEKKNKKQSQKERRGSH